jgi:MFS family permease
MVVTIYILDMLADLYSLPRSASFMDESLCITSTHAFHRLQYWLRGGHESGCLDDPPLLAGVFGSCRPAIGLGSIADCSRVEDRGKAMSVWILPVLLGPALGPVVGGYLSEAIGWRWDFGSWPSP